MFLEYKNNYILLIHTFIHTLWYERRGNDRHINIHINFDHAKRTYERITDSQAGRQCDRQTDMIVDHWQYPNDMRLAFQSSTAHSNTLFSHNEYFLKCSFFQCASSLLDIFYFSFFYFHHPQLDFHLVP